ncbi:hypothetical protein AMTR_s00030p00052790 [Amborella trichopoda]|uniref:Uncharacterized protein n=1 Tax=Amborella trichopoda TaxID=13333 RepID=U5D6L9_AMBTC|nr:hypothetical protein AMTR_s00030p00052790 [Amborella trichopoda]
MMESAPTRLDTGDFTYCDGVDTNSSSYRYELPGSLGADSDSRMMESAPTRLDMGDQNTGDFTYWDGISTDSSSYRYELPGSLGTDSDLPRHRQFHIL